MARIENRQIKISVISRKFRRARGHGARGKAAAEKL